jgi:uncharacterized phage protein (TIGR01671 family)
MREYKFRAYQKSDSLDRTRGMYKVDDIVWYDKPKDGYTGEVFFTGDDSSSEYLEDVILMQYIGLTDMRDTEIYEGDIVAYEDENGEVVAQVAWDDKLAAYILIDKDGEIADLFYEIGEDVVEVIGNIYDDKRLLK